MIIVKSVDENSIAKELGIKAGDKLIQINGKKVEDVFDYLYLEGEDSFDFTFLIDGVEVTFEVEKEDGENIGVSFEEDFKIRLCKNKCVFCFVDQMPKGMRDTLYCKDDDYRLSFVSGSYITLTNDSDDDIDRIIRLHLSPIYVSVHSTSPLVRKKLLKNPRSTKILEQIEKLTKNGILVHAQVVMCPGINDGEELKKTIEDLHSFYPKVCSLAVVPVGLTKYRENLPKIKPVDNKNAIETIKIVEEYSKKYREIYGTGFVYCSDEFYCLANMKVNTKEWYDDYPQIENGVGLIRKFTDEFNEKIRMDKKFSSLKTLLVTGVSFYPYLKELLYKVQCPHKILCVHNKFFGESVTVAGLLTGRDIVEAIGDEKYDRIILPQNMFKEFGDVFLDNMTKSEFENLLNTKVIVSKNDGGELYELL